MDNSATTRMLKRNIEETVKEISVLDNVSTARPSAGATTQVPSKITQNPLISEHCVDYLNYRIQQEEYSSRVYLAMSMWLNNKGYSGAAGLWKTYSDEELKHADWSRTYLLSFGIQPLTPRLDQPAQNFSGLPQIIQDSFDHEILVSTQCKQMASESFKKGDHMLYELSLKFLKEQVEEHDKMQTWVDKLEAFGTDKLALRLLDNEMGG
jgi:ferritin